MYRLRSPKIMGEVGVSEVRFTYAHSSLIVNLSVKEDHAECSTHTYVTEDFHKPFG